ncbi:hypothetical protein AN189_03605 [Loktanella sp. 3ANDIMAR09]|uniref:DUF2155 domain-containing protein n=1 Tax=Loktanella sp. 3ANDIMAR09 TaxID=1225657 RepID=UPI000700B77D|nr:DUF2155 domain-containing protein [Loktanella sp. 3ANDIMAR09]KQI69501.1 hypothetical protein AN189_03605 [Loktanella sp. 3ANDIMAR09]
MIRALAFVSALVPMGATAQQAVSQPGAELRVLDKVTGQVADVAIQVGDAAVSGLVMIQLNDCRVPADNPSGDAFAEMSVTYGDDATPVFSGWMVASAPALNAMDHPRYDVWVIRCTAA